MALPPRVHRAGIATVRHRGSAWPLTVYRCRLPRSLRWDDQPGRIRIPLDRATTAAGFGFGQHGWHPHVETLRWLDRQAVDKAAEPTGPAPPADPTSLAAPAPRDLPDVPDLADSPLGRLYAAFRPRTVREAVLDDVDDPVPGLSDVPLVRGQLRELWNPHGPRRPAGDPPALDQPGLYWGPASADHLAAEVRRTLGLRREMAERGYRDGGPGSHAVSGYLLVRGDDYRFVVHEGHHRLACLTALGHDTVPAYLSPKVPPVVDEARLGRWTRGRRPRYPMATADLLFARLFASTGADKARRLGVLTA